MVCGLGVHLRDGGLHEDAQRPQGRPPRAAAGRRGSDPSRVGHAALHPRAHALSRQRLRGRLHLRGMLRVLGARGGSRRGARLPPVPHRVRCHRHHREHRLCVDAPLKRAQGV